MTRTTIITLLMLASIQGVAQMKSSKAKPFINGMFHTTWAINENYTLDPDDDEPLLIPNSIFGRLGFGYQLGRRWAASFNAGYDYHLQYFIHAIPTYGTLRYNISEDAGDTFFMEYSRGKLWRPSWKFEDGDYSAFGIGWRVMGTHKTHVLLKVTYHSKRIQNFENNRLSSLSFGVGFSIF